MGGKFALQLNWRGTFSSFPGHFGHFNREALWAFASDRYATQLTYKTLFLVVLASARHISGLHALSVGPPFLIENLQYLIWSPIRLFCWRRQSRQPCWWTPNLRFSFPTLFLGLSAIQIRNKEVQGQNAALFVCYELVKAARLLSKATLAHWMITAIREA